MLSLNGLGEESAAVAVLAASIAAGVFLGDTLGIGLDDSLPESVQRVSSSLGWSYFMAWSCSFWPQIIENQRTKDVSGLSPDYLLFSLLGYAWYGAYNGALLFNDGVRVGYSAVHGGTMPDVSLSDFAFCVHAIAAGLIVTGQYIAMQRPGSKGLSTMAVGMAAALLAACGGAAMHIGATCDPSDCTAWLPLLTLMGGIKVVMTMIKYSPQVLHNHRRRSTEGWSLTNVLLDLGGGLLSFSQVALDAAARHDLSVITGNPAKIWIAVLSIGYDLVFLGQHYVFYRDDQNEEEEEEESRQASAAVASGIISRRGSAAEPAVVPVVTPTLALWAERARRGSVRVFAEGAKGAARGRRHSEGQR